MLGRIPVFIVSVVLGLGVVVGLSGCSSDQLRQQARQHDRIADYGDRAAAALDQAWDSAEAALIWVTDPINQQVIALLPAATQARIEQAILAGADLRPILRDGAARLRASADEFRGLAQNLRDVADQERADWVNLLLAVGGGLTGTGVLGRLLWGFGVNQGATGVAQSIQWGRVHDAEFDAKFEDDAAEGVKAMKASLAEQPAAVRKAVEKVVKS